MDEDIVRLVYFTRVFNCFVIMKGNYVKTARIVHRPKGGIASGTLVWQNSYQIRPIGNNYMYDMVYNAWSKASIKNRVNEAHQKF